ncbi:hypothetical protein EXIGLDRAFT_835963 [Exidia glandulosa HHB12029]|uniref:F-box domain-containing protein n=1 Tax=Exidia glandulosa HHB12029 TaxID=1314781 RepID=A0A165I8M6_EXIGL|nr:hypothetical protein EXIGLDRAFT_835963 [Exidia glandulosa HHB12029]
MGAYISILRNSGPLSDGQPELSNLQTRHPGGLPPELLAEIGSFLPYPTLYRAVCVSRYWRAALLASPRLWDDITVCLLQKRKDRWTDVLELLFARNAGRPLSMTLGWVNDSALDTDWVALDSISALVASHMWHMKSLSLQIPYRHDMLLLLVPAPILETLEVVATDGTGPKWLPVDLFAGIAPRLSSLHLDEAELPLQCPALRTVTKLALISLYMLCEPHLRSKIAYLPLLDEFKVSVLDLDGYRDVGTGPPCELALYLHLTFAPGLESMLALFPRARRVSYDFDRAFRNAPDPDPEDVAAAVKRAMHTVPNPTSIHIRWEPPVVDYPDALTVVLDDRLVIEHVELFILKPALNIELIQSVFVSVTSLTVPEELWELFELCTLLPNLDVTLFVSQASTESRDPGCTPKLYLNARYAPKSIRSLALARPPKCFYSEDAPHWILSATLLEEFVASVVAPGSLQSLLLHGIVLDGTATFDSGDLVARTVADLVTPEVDAARRSVNELVDWEFLI